MHVGVTFRGTDMAGSVHRSLWLQSFCVTSWMIYLTWGGEGSLRRECPPVHHYKGPSDIASGNLIYVCIRSFGSSLVTYRPGGRSRDGGWG